MPADAAPIRRRARRMSRRWIGILIALVVVGATASWAVADGAARRKAAADREQFQRSALQVAGKLQLIIGREEDLVAMAVGHFASAPDATENDLRAWTNAVELFERHAELVAVGRAQATTEPSGFCAPLVELARQGSPTPTAATCTAPTAAELATSRDTGIPIYRVEQVGGVQLLALGVPTYGSGLSAPSDAARRAGFAGWLVLRLDPAVVLAAAAQDAPVDDVAFAYRDPYSNVSFATPRSTGDLTTATFDISLGWTATVGAALPTVTVWTNRDALWTLLTGLGLTALLVTMIVVLVTGRSRAWRLVEQRTADLQHLALHDALTGLPNRALIMDRIEQMLRRTRRGTSVGAVLYIDLDDFKNVNDTLGHDVGDRLLQGVAARLQTALRETDTIGRMGGDEFVVLVDAGSLEVDPELVAMRLRDVLDQPFEVLGAPSPLAVHASVGVALAGDVSPADLLRAADLAMYEAKASGKNRYEVYRPELQSDVSRRLELELDLRSALEQHEFRLVYQPIYDLDDLSIVGVEALLRWDHPALGEIGPEQFVPILEQTGQMPEIGSWVLHEACNQMAQWHARGDDIDVSVNVSGRQLDDDRIVDDVRDALATSGLAPASLMIEITETALMRHVDATAERLARIKALGVRIAIDDFGTGYSSLAYLQQFPIDCLKIDRRFTNALTSSPESRALVGTLVQLGRDLGLSTLAEGVETASEVDHLRNERVDRGQGFLLSKPLEAEALERILLQPMRPTGTGPVAPPRNT
jgi:diguanylate cyclase (GGDEF)-like protein